jgi:DNA-binding transcriptional LysR family regulator
VGDSLTVEQFAAMRHIAFHFPGAYGPSIIDRELWRLGLKREQGMSIHSYFDAPRVLSQTDMVCTMPKVLGRHFAEVHGLKMVRSPLQLEFPVFLLWPRGLDADEGHRWLRETLIDIFKREESLG